MKTLNSGFLRLPNERGDRRALKALRDFFSGGAK
jgi:hypothetical protein